jgi:AmmeMemoRadiSam system protein B
MSAPSGAGREAGGGAVYHGSSMSSRLAALRRSLDVMPSPVTEQPGLLLRDPFGYTSQVVIIPPPLVPFLGLFDGRHDEQDLAAALYRATGDLGAQSFARRLAATLGGNGFLENEELARRRGERHRAFAEAPRREAAHAGQAYPDDVRQLGALLDGWLGSEPETPAAGDLLAIAAPHVSPEGGFRCYGAAYGALPAAASTPTFVVLGTSHHGAPDRFGLTRKSFATPLGVAQTDTRLVDELVREAGEAVLLEEYCHAIEHSIEFQVLFLQRRFGPELRIVPILCGPFARAAARGRPEDDSGVARFLDALKELHAREGARLLWVLGVDLAHVGQRYGDRFEARVGDDRLRAVEERDRRRLQTLLDGDAGRFWDEVQEREDELRWCGAAPLYAFVRATSPAHGRLLRYEQWNIDPASVVSFASLAFGRTATTPAGEGGL